MTEREKSFKKINKNSKNHHVHPWLCSKHYLKNGSYQQLMGCQWWAALVLDSRHYNRHVHPWLCSVHYWKNGSILQLMGCHWWAYAKKWTKLLIRTSNAQRDRPRTSDWRAIQSAGHSLWTFGNVAELSVGPRAKHVPRTKNCYWKSEAGDEYPSNLLPALWDGKPVWNAND